MEAAVVGGLAKGDPSNFIKPVDTPNTCDVSSAGSERRRLNAGR
jgi:hypothetical protein